MKVWLATVEYSDNSQETHIVDADRAAIDELLYTTSYVINNMSYALKTTIKKIRWQKKEIYT